MEEKTFSLFDGLREIWKQKILALVSFLLFSIIIFLGLFIYTKNGATYTSQFQLDFIGINDNKYPNGSFFNYNNIISYERLEKVKNNNSDYDNLDLVSLSEDGNINIKEEYQYASDNTTVLKSFYTISLSANLFKNEEQAKSFITDLLSVELEKINSQSSNLPKFLTNEFVNATTEYFDIVTYLQRQYDTLLNHYQILLDTYSINGLLAEHNLYNKIEHLKKQFLDARIVNSYILEIVKNGYIKNASVFQIDLEMDVAVLEEERLLNINKIAELTAAGQLLQSSDDLSGVLAALLVRQEDIIHDLDIATELLNKCQTTGSNTDTTFEAKLNESISVMSSFCDEYDMIYTTFIKEKTSIHYVNNTILLYDSLLPTIFIPFIAIILGAGITLVIVYFRYKLQEDRRKNELTK